MRLVGSQVNSFAPQVVPVGAAYRFERLPSQQADPAAQVQLEAMTEQALSKVGLKHLDVDAPYTVQVTATQRVQSTVGDGPPFGWRLGWGLGHGRIGLGHNHGVLFPGLDARPDYWREVSLILREQATQAVLFESRASNDGPWPDSAAILPAMLDAALQGFPTPPTGPRLVNIEIPR